MATLNVAPYGYTSWRHISYTSVLIYSTLMSSPKPHFCSANSYTYDATQATPVQLIQLHRCRLSGYTCVSALATLHEFVQATFL